MDITGEQLLAVFAEYNLQIWPLQILAYILGLIGLYFGFKKTPLASRIISTILGFFWLWVSLMFWLPSAQQGFTIGYAFVAIFTIEGVLFLVQALRLNLHFGTFSKNHTIAGLTLMLYAMLGYPLLGYFIGHRYPHTPPFGLTPCPLIIFTLGLLLLTKQKVPKFILVIPFFYGLSGVLWITKGIWEDIGLVLSAIVAVSMIVRRDKRLSENRNSTTWSLDISKLL